MLTLRAVVLNLFCSSDLWNFEWCYGPIKCLNEPLARTRTGYIILHLWPQLVLKTISADPWLRTSVLEEEEIFTSFFSWKKTLLQQFPWKDAFVGCKRSKHFEEFETRLKSEDINYIESAIVIYRMRFRLNFENGRVNFDECTTFFVTEVSRFPWITFIKIK